MTNTLHRFGDAGSFRDDYIIFAIASKGIAVGWRRRDIGTVITAGQRTFGPR